MSNNRLPLGTIVRFRKTADTEFGNPPTEMVGRITDMSEVFEAYEVTVERLTYLYPDGWHTTIVPPEAFRPMVDFTDSTLTVLDSIPELP